MTLPSGTVTFLFTDIEGSTKLAQGHPDKWEALLRRHHAILQSAMDAHDGHVFQIIGDAFCVAFHTAGEAIHAAVKSQTDLYYEDWGDTPIKVRMGINTGTAQAGEDTDRSGGYTGYTSMARVQRLMSAAHGGQVLISLGTAELVRDELPENVSLRDMGERRLKDLIRPERIYQLVIPDLPVDFPPLKTLDAYRHNLPMQMTSFIGREKEMAEIKDALAGHRLVTLTGSGGAGKTRLSLQVAADLLDQFPNGVWFVELAPITNPDLIPQTILSAAEMQTQPGRSSLDSLTDFLREKTSLLVLDNCEHLIEACARLAETLLNAAPNLKILASSREALCVKGEQAWHVPSLSIPDLKQLPPLEGLSQYEAVRLFIDRALLLQPHFSVTNENAPAVAQICYRLDGIPLAIELAAARLRMLSAEQIASRLDDRFRLLIGGARTALPRQQTLRATIDWSYDILSDNERLLLQRLSVFAGGWTLEAAERICSGGQIHADDVIDLLAHLVDKSLVIVDELPGRIRYRLLETVRQYAREKMLDTGEGERVRTQHLAYFLKFAEEAEPHLARKEQLEWFDRLGLDHDNLRAALEWAMDTEQDDPPEAGLRLVNALRPFWYIQGHWLEARAWLARGLAKDGQSTRTVARARALISAAYFETDDMRQLIELCDRSLVLCYELGDKPGIAEALLIKGSMGLFYLDRPAAKSSIEESLSLFRELDDKSSIARAYYNLGAFSSSEYDFPVARQYYEESLKLSRGLGERRFLAISLLGLGDLALNEGNLSVARGFYVQSLSLAQELGDKIGIATCLGYLGTAVLGQGDYQQAEGLLEKRLSIVQELGNRRDLAYASCNLGRVARFRNDYEKAIRLQTESLTYCREMDEKNLIPTLLFCLGELARLQGDHAAAHSFLIEGLIIAKEMYDRQTIAYLFEESAALSVALGQAKQAATLFGAAQALRDAIHVVLLPVERAEVDRNIASAQAQLDKATFEAARVEGRAMTMEDAIAYALKELE